MVKFASRFNTFPCKNSDKIYDRHDNVNRVSYVDSTLMVKRLIAEGRDLNAARAAALRSGMYSGNLNEIEHDDSIVVPVYEQDPAIAAPIIDEAKKNLTSRLQERKREQSESSAPKSDVTDSSQDNKRNADN